MVTGPTVQLNLQAGVVGIIKDNEGVLLGSIPGVRAQVRASDKPFVLNANSDSQGS